MALLLLFAYAQGERSTRKIERRCREDVALRVLCANQTPDHATIARFRTEHEEELKNLHSQVLALCAKAGLGSLGLVALDSTKLADDAAEDVQAADDDEQPGEGRLPRDLAEQARRRVRFTQADCEIDAQVAA